MNSKKTVIIFSLTGLIPFYLEEFYKLFFGIDNSLSIFFENFSLLYGALIVSFLSGMQWEQLIINHKKKYYILPILPVLFVWTYKINFLNPKEIIIVSLIYSFLIDFILLKNFRKKWFLKLRFSVTVLAILSYFM